MVKNLLSLLSTRQTSILSGATILMATVFASRILGLVRDRLLAYTFTPDQTAVFLASFRVPDLLFQLLIFGTVSVAFIPVFTDHLENKEKKEAFEFASEILNLVLIGFSLVCFIVFIFSEPLTTLVVPGFSPSQQIMAAHITQIILLGQIMLAIGAFFAGILQAYQRFIIPAVASIFYNVGIIIGIVLLSPSLGLLGPAVGVIVGAALQVLIQFPLVNSLGFKYKFSLSLASEGMKDVISMMSMRTIGVAVEQINETIGIVLSSLISSSSVTFLTFASHLQTVPIGLFGATLAQAALPVLSKEKTRGEGELFKSTLLTTMHQILFLTLPAAAIMIVLRVPVVRLVFGASQFDWHATVITGKTLAFLAIGLVAQSVVLLLIRAFYALKDTRTPVIVSVVSVLINIGLSYFFVTVMRLDVWGLGISYAVASNTSFILLLIFLSRKMGGFSREDIFNPAVKMLVAASISAIALYLPVKALDDLVIDTTRTVNLLILTVIAGVAGLSIYLLLVWIFRVRELTTFIDLIKKIINVKLNAPEGEVIEEPTHHI